MYLLLPVSCSPSRCFPAVCCSPGTWVGGSCLWLTHLKAISFTFPLVRLQAPGLPHPSLLVLSSLYLQRWKKNELLAPGTSLYPVLFLFLCWNPQLGIGIMLTIKARAGRQRALGQQWSTKLEPVGSRGGQEADAAGVPSTRTEAKQLRDASERCRAVKMRRDLSGSTGWSGSEKSWH